MRTLLLCLAVALLAFNTTAGAATITFDTDPFAGSTALTTPGRQVVGAEPFVSFTIATDVYEFDPAVFGISGIHFVNDLAENLPSSGVNVVVLRTFDNDADAATPFGAGNAANLIAERMTSPGAGFFVYFNSGLDLARLVYSTDLNDNTSDLKIMARMTNLVGAPGRDAMATFTAANFRVVPEPSSILLLTSAGVAWAVRDALRRRRRS